MPALRIGDDGMSKVTCPQWAGASASALPHEFKPPMQPIFKACLASATLLAAITTSANAQSTSGNIGGEAVVGDTVIVTNFDTGFKRELKIEKAGKYQVRRVPIGEYQVVRVHKDGSADPAQTVFVKPDATARVAEPANTGVAARGTPASE